MTELNDIARKGGRTLGKALAKGLAQGGTIKAKPAEAPRNTVEDVYGPVDRLKAFKDASTVATDSGNYYLTPEAAETVLNAPEWQGVRREIIKLHEKYEAKAKKLEAEFNKRNP